MATHPALLVLESHVRTYRRTWRGNVITTFINKERDQWATVGSRRDMKVIFCLYASGIGRGSVNRRSL